MNLSDNRKNEKTHNEKRRGQDCLDQIGQTSRTSKRSKHSLPAIRANWPAPWSPKERPIAIEVRLGPFFLTGVDFSQFSRKNGDRCQKNFCGRLISKKFYALKTPWKSLPVIFKPEVISMGFSERVKKFFGVYHRFF